MFKIETCQGELILYKQRRSIAALGKWMIWDELGRFDNLEQAELAMREHIYAVPPGTRFYDAKGELMEHREGKR